MSIHNTDKLPFLLRIRIKKHECSLAY